MTVSKEFEQYIDAVSDLDLGHLQSMGVGGKAIVNAGLIGIGRIEIDGSYWHPEESGKSALVLPVGDSDRFSSFVDLVAFRTSQPDVWWMRTGFGPLLGYQNLEKCIHFEKQLTVHSNPLQWLQSECEGICVLDWGSCLAFWFSGIKHFYCPNPKTGYRLEKALKREISLPEIRVGGLQHAA
ncbi:hypothetical protein A9Q83_16650 [Alphaproteobacteria bacterium 46_93_T64]|nr:hypothetical protein A9Q83_16650 [Alphaproteobacteria bacterium 46_93_T64]